MYGNELIGGVVGIVGWDNFSPAARGVGAIFTDAFVSASIMPTTSIAIYDDGNVLEVVNVLIGSLEHRYSAEILNGRVVKLQRRKNSTGWKTLPIMYLDFVAFGSETTYEEDSATIDFYDSIESSAGWEELEEERQLLREMMWNTDNDFPPAAWDRMAELGI